MNNSKYKFLLFFLLNSSFAIAQIQSKDNDDPNVFLLGHFPDGFTIIIPDSLDSSSYNFISKYIKDVSNVKGLNLFTPEELRGGLNFRSLNIDSDLSEIRKVFYEEAKIGYKVCLIYPMATIQNRFISCVFLFKNKDFNKFRKEAIIKVSRKQLFYQGEVNHLRTSNYKKYSIAYLLIKSIDEMKKIEIK